MSEFRPIVSLFVSQSITCQDWKLWSLDNDSMYMALVTVVTFSKSGKIGTATWLQGRALRQASRWIRLAEKHRRYLRFIPCSLLGRTSQAKLRPKKSNGGRNDSVFAGGWSDGGVMSVYSIFAELRLEQCRFTIWLFNIAMENHHL